MEPGAILIDLYPIYPRLTRFAEDFEPGLELTDWEIRKIIESLVDGVFNDKDYETIKVVSSRLVELGFERKNATVCAVDILDYFCERILGTHSPVVIRKRYESHTVRLDSDQQCLFLKKKSKSRLDHEQNAVIGLSRS